MTPRSAALLVSLANGLSLTRLLATPVVVYLVWRGAESDAHRLAAFWLLMALHLSDVLDGYMGRTGSRVLAKPNHFGQMADPLADKMYIGAAFVTLALTQQLPGWFVALAIFRDLSIVGGWTFVYRRFGVRLLPNTVGKLTDASAAVLLGAALLAPAAVWTAVLMQITSALMLFSGYSYGRMAMDAGSRATLQRLRAARRARRTDKAASRRGVRLAS